MALPLAIMSHEDCTTALYQLSAEYDPAIREDFPGATRLAWNVTLFLRFVVGFLLVFISFIQIVQSTTITDLFLNLEAIVFVGSIDNFAFWLAEKNFIVRGFKDSCDAVKDISFKASGGSRTTIIRRIIAFLTLGVLIAGWVVIFGKQKSGVYLQDKACNSFDVTFADFTLDLKAAKIDITTDPKESLRFYYRVNLQDETDTIDDGQLDELIYSAFSGTYRIGAVEKGVLEIVEQRAVYYEEVPGKVDNSDEIDNTYRDNSLGKFFYCEGAWIFTVEALQDAFDREDDSEELQKCGRWLLRSPPTKEFFLENVPTDNWRIWTGSVEIADGIDIICNDCKGVVDCNYHGECVNKRCVCNDDGFGPTCGLDPPCLQLDFIVVGERAEAYEEIADFSLVRGDGGIATDTNDLLVVYGRPVYVAPVGGGDFLLINYLGSRWNVAIWNNATFDDFFLGDIPAHAFWDGLFQGAGFAASEPTKSGSPLGLNWELSYDAHSRGDYGPFLARYEFDLALNCINRECPGQDICGSYGQCEEGRCACDECFGGYFCEFGPTDDYAFEDFKVFVNNGTALGEYADIFWAGIDPFETCPDEADEALLGRRSRRLKSKRA
jgi:uncharacterized membrane protein YbaN (DUF454 family)